MIKRILAASLVFFALTSTSFSINLSQKQISILTNRNAGNITSTAIALVPTDFKNIFGYPFLQPKNTLYFTAGILALIAVDKPTTKFVQKHINPIFKWKLPGPFSLGSGAGKATVDLLLGIGGLYLYSNVENYSKGETAAALSVKAVLFSELYSQLFLKSITGRLRPNPDLGTTTPEGYSNNPWAFGHYNGLQYRSTTKGSSFPSFHFTLFFSVARVFANEYNNNLIPYSVAALGLLPNFQSHHHWVSDMVAGGLIGTMIGNQVTNDYYNFLAVKYARVAGVKLSYSVTPIISQGEMGMAFNGSF